MLTKQAIDVPFAEGLDTKTDPKRVSIGKFLKLENSVFQKGGLLQKRNGYAPLASLPSANYSYLTTFNGNLTAFGQMIAAYNNAGDNFVSKGTIAPLSVRTLSLIRNNLNQTACDAAIAPNGLVCTVYLESNGTTTAAKYAIADSVTGQNIVAPSVIPVSSGVVTGGMRVFCLGNIFVLVFTNVITAVSHLQYVAISSANPTAPSANTDIASLYIPASTLAWDGYVVGSNLFIAYNTTAGGQQIVVNYLTTSLALAPTAASFATYKATTVSVTADMTNPASPVVYVSFYRSDTQLGYMLAVDTSLSTLMAPVAIITSGAFFNIISAAQNGVCSVFFDGDDTYSFDASLPNHLIDTRDVTLATATAGPAHAMMLGLGLASKAFIIDGTIYLLASYQSKYQPTYFLLNGSTCRTTAPVIAAKLAYQNGGGYLSTGLPGVTITDTTKAWIPYLFKDLIQAVNKNTDVPTGSQVAGIYSQTGINLGTFDIGTQSLDTAEIGSDLHISGGFLWMYDGYLPVEHNFFLFPDTDSAVTTNIAAWAATGGSMAAKPDGASNTNAYFYQFTYEWTDNQGNAFRSAPSVPVPVTTTGAGTAGSVTLNIPTLRCTMKTANPVKIVIYRWSVAQQAYYQVTSITSPLLNDTTSDSVTYVDTLADATILGNNLIYTTGGVLENTSAPATDLLTIFDTRLWTVDSEDRNLLNFSKTCIEGVPVEMSDLLSMFIPPTVATATGEVSSFYPMDDKLIISKGGGSLVYVNGTGPDNTGANNQYSPPIFITSTVGCANQRSMVLTPQGLMFESNKGIWLLGRGLDTQYIGAPVEDLTHGATVTSAVTVPNTNQVRFTLSTGITLMYDYFYSQWGTFKGVPAVSSCIFEGMHTFINSSGAAYQESEGQYLDGSNPVLMMFQTGPLRLDQLQSYQRAYFFYILGTFLSPHKLQINLFYDYETSPSQSLIIKPDNYSTPFGSGDSQSPFGQGNPFAGPSNLESWRVFLQRQRCMAFGIQIQEIFDSSFGTVAGAGLTLSGLNVICGFKKPFRPQSAAQSVG